MDKKNRNKDPLNKKEIKSGRTAFDERNREQTIKKFLHSATLLFSKYGFDGTTTKEIALHAKTNESLIFRYFGGKDGLFSSVVENFFSTKKTLSLPYPEQPTLRQEIEAYVLFQFSEGLKYQRFYKILVGQSALDPKLSRYLQQNLSIKEDLRLQNRLLRFQNKGDIRQDYELTRICAQIISRWFSTFYVSHLVFRFSKENCINSLKFFAEIYSKGLA